MRNKFRIPAEILYKIAERDAKCSYCLKKLLYPYDQSNHSDSATIEHLSFDGPFYWKDNLHKSDIVMACGSCNSSRSNKTLNKWFRSEYCIRHNINQGTVAKTVQQYIIRNPHK